MSQWKCSECGSTETKRRAKGMCAKCYHIQYLAKREADDPGLRARQSRESYHRHREKRIAKITEKNRELKWEIIRRLGGKCACCGEATPEFMTIDHIHNDGASHRKRVTGSSRASSPMIYRDIRNQGIPKDKYRVL